MGERLLIMVADLNLLKQDGDRWSLTELGQASVEEGQTYVPEDDLWRFHWSDDPLVKSPLLHVQRIPPANRWDRDNTPTKHVISTVSKDNAFFTDLCEHPELHQEPNAEHGA